MNTKYYIKFYKNKLFKEQKKREQLNIGKIKFELIPIYMNQTYLTFILTTTNTSNNITSDTKLLKPWQRVIIFFGLLTMIYVIFLSYFSSFYHPLLNNSLLLNIMSELIFNSPSHYTDLILTQLF